MKSLLAQTPHGPIEYTVSGSGPSVLVCHGTSSDCFSPYLSTSLRGLGFQVISPSRPGYGRTPLATGRTAAQAAAAMVELLDCLGIQSCSVVAISGGGPTGVALAASFPQRVERVALVAAGTRPEGRLHEPNYQNQVAFYGPAHGLTWRMLRLVGYLSPRGMARQTLATFSTHDPEDGLSRLSAADVQSICQFYRGNSSRAGALNDLTHTVGADLLHQVRQPTLVVHSREDKAVPFAQAEWSLQHIPQAELCESGFTGHFFWVGPDFPAILQRLAAFLQDGSR